MDSSSPKSSMTPRAVQTEVTGQSFSDDLTASNDVYRVQAFGQANTDTNRAGANTSTHPAHEHAAPTLKDSRSKEAIPASQQCAVASNSRFIPLSTTQGGAMLLCDERLS